MNRPPGADLLPRLPPKSIKKREIIRGNDGARIFNFFDPDGNRFEFMQFPPESKQRRPCAALGGGDFGDRLVN
ncbi:MAG: hypothetical protein NTW86_01990 [Candidatus Sumerlaeota bacterium]|nr:hypothetical protein [Candidatus Sumerlaeota bacterium]